MDRLGPGEEPPCASEALITAQPGGAWPVATGIAGSAGLPVAAGALAAVLCLLFVCGAAEELWRLRKLGEATVWLLRAGSAVCVVSTFPPVALDVSCLCCEESPGLSANAVDGKASSKLSKNPPEAAVSDFGGGLSVCD